MKIDPTARAAIPGSYPIATVHISGEKADGTPAATIESATCDECGGWASNLWQVEQIAATGEFDNRRISRKTDILVFTCPEHHEKIGDELCEEYGGCSGGYRPEPLAITVAKEARDIFQYQREGL